MKCQKFLLTFTEFEGRHTCTLKSVPWILVEFCHNRIVQSPDENYLYVCRQHKEKSGLMKTAIY